MIRLFKKATLSAAVILMIAGCTNKADTTSSSPAASSAPQALLTTSISRYALIVPVSIEGKTWQFLLDTGAALTVIDNHVAAAITRPAADNEVPARIREGLAEGVSTVDGTLAENAVKFWYPRPIEIGRREFRSATPWLGLDLSLMTAATGRRIDGIIGADIFRQLTWQVDNVQRTLTLLTDVPSTTGYQKCVPYRNEYGQPPEIQIGLKSGNWVPFRIDTGATDSLAPRDLLHVVQREGGDIEPIGETHMATANGAHRAGEYLVGGLIFDGMPVGRLRIQESTGGLNNLGMGFFSRFDSYALIPAEMVFCYNARNFTRDDHKALRPISLIYAGGHIEIGDGGMGDVSGYGLKPGDILLEVNGRKVQPADIEELRNDLGDMPKGKLTILIDRGGERKTIGL
jgi:predicted aspartyl protease